MYYAGHDTNIYFLRALLNLNWVTASYNPNQSPPGGMLRFELLTDGGAGKFVKLYFETQSYSQQRSATALSAELGEVPDRSFVAIPKCATGPENSCPLETFKAVAAAALDAACVKSTA